MNPEAMRTTCGATTIDPATGRTFAFHAFQTTHEIDELLDGAVSAFQIWRNYPIEQRTAVLRRFPGIISRKCGEFATTITREMGKPIAQSRAEIAKCAATCEWYAEHGINILENESTSVDENSAVISYSPLGVILGVMPWNYPFWQAIRAIVPIIISGNGFLLKHAPNCVSTALNVAAAFEEAGVPKGLVSVLNIAQPDIQSVIEDDRIAAVTLTGSVRAGAAVASQAGGAIKKTVLELGGSDPFIVLADADLPRAVDAAVKARFQNAGQTCIAAKRIIVEAPVVGEFSARFVEAVKVLKIGNPMDEETDIGPMARADLRIELASQVTRSIAQGAEVLLDGGPTGPDDAVYFRPVVLGNVRPGMAVFDEETFGPCAAIIVAKDVDDAINLANQSEFGLSAAIWTGDVEAAQRLARKIETGGVFINDVSRSDPRIPIGGIRKSGYGRELSYFGVREFTNAKVIWTA